MRPRLDFHRILVSLLGSSNVYFQPPEGFKLQYPCIVYNRNDIRTNFADNRVYIEYTQYSVTVIDADPDSTLIGLIMKLPLTSFDRPFTNGGLNHYVFTINY